MLIIRAVFRKISWTNFPKNYFGKLFKQIISKSKLKLQNLYITISSLLITSIKQLV